MPRGKYVNHKGRSRQFSSSKELVQESEEDAKKKDEAKNEEDEPEKASDKSEGGKTASSHGGQDKNVSDIVEKESPNRVQKGRRHQLTSPKELVEGSKQNAKKKDEPKSKEDKPEKASDKSEGGKTVSIQRQDKNVSGSVEKENQSRVQNKTTVNMSRVVIPGKFNRSEPTKRQIKIQLRTDRKKERRRSDLARLSIVRQEREEAAARREAEKQEKEAKKNIGTANQCVS